MRADASWRRMYPVQPPAKIEKVVSKGGCRCGTENIEMGRVKDEFWAQVKNGGIMMGGLWDLVVLVIDSKPDPEFFVEWMMFPVVVKDGDDEEEEDTWDGGGWRDGEAGWKHWRVVPAQGDAVAIHVDHSRVCYPEPAVPCGLLIAECDERMIAYE